MAVLLFILRLIGWILLALLVILLAALVLPLGIRVSYHPAACRSGHITGRCNLRFGRGAARVMPLQRRSLRPPRTARR